MIDILGGVNNQNAFYNQAAGTSGLQPSGVSQSSGNGFQQSGGLVLSTNSGTLNQSGPTQAVGSATVYSDETNKAPLNSEGFPAFGFIILLVVLVSLAWAVQRKIS